MSFGSRATTRNTRPTGAVGWARTQINLDGSATRRCTPKLALDLRAQQQLVQGYIPFSLGERRDRLRMLALLETGQDAFGRDHFYPGHFTASAFVLSPERDALLMILHKKLDRWLQPGGHVEADDLDLAMAAVREVYEETGLHPTQLQLERDGIFDVDIHTIPPHGDEPGHEHFDVRFLMHARSAELNTNGDVAEARWVKLGDVDKMGTDTSVNRIVERLRAPL